MASYLAPTVPRRSTLVAVTSTLLRLSVWIFLRWVPGHHFLPVILALFVSFLAFSGLEAWSGMQKEQSVNVKVTVDRSVARVVLSSAGSCGKRALLLPERSSLLKVDSEDDDEDEDERIELEHNILEWRPASNPGLSLLKSLVFGIPSRSKILTLITLTVNTALVVMAADLVLRPLWHPSNDSSFARVGYVSDSTASILLREPDASQLPIYVSYRQSSTKGQPQHGGEIFRHRAWEQASKVYWLSNDTDFTYALQINHLYAFTKYQYSTSNNHSGFFTTAPLVGQTDPLTEKFTFLTTSCIKPRFPYHPFDHPLTIAGFKHVAKWIPLLGASFMLFLGDFIYVDVPWRFGFDTETYRREYRQVYASPDWPAVSENLPWIHTIDNHEIANDWDRNNTAPYLNAMDPWTHYQHVLNPPPARPDTTYYVFTQGPVSFFMLDTRHFRTPASAARPESPEKSMLGPDQLASLFAFLSSRPPNGVRWKIVVSSVPFTRNWRINSDDTWAGYLYERQRILEAMWDASSSTSAAGIVILSGDRHEFAVTSFPPPKAGRWGPSATVHEFSTSPLSMFYLPVRSYWEMEGQDDVCIKYLPDGNSKFGAVEVANLAGGEQSVLKFRLFVDGEEVWSYAVMSPAERSGRGKEAVWG